VSDNPREALEGTRKANAEANKKARITKKTGETKTSAPSSHAATPAEQAIDAFDKMDDQSAVNLIKSQAGNHGLTVVGEDEARTVAKVAKGGDAEAVFAAFETLSATARLTLAKRIAKAVGGTLDLSAFDSGDDGLDIPKALKRTRKTKKAA
jgi:hypothetical protein